MPDEPTTTPEPSTEPAAEDPKPTSSSPPLSPDTKVRIHSESGEQAQVALGELVDAYWGMQAAPGEDVSKKAELLDRVIAGDQQAAQELMQMANATFSQPEPETPPTPEQYQQQIDALQQKITQVEGQLQRQQPLHQGIEQARWVNDFGNVIGQHADKLPHLAKLDESGSRAGSNRVYRQFESVRQELANAGTPFESLPREQQERAAIYALSEAEKELAGLVAPWAGTAPPAAPKGPQAPAAVDDQQDNRQEHEGIPARLQIDRRGQARLSNAQPPEPNPVPATTGVSQPPIPSAGTPPMAVQGTPRKPGPFSMDQLLGRMATQRREMEASQ